MYIAFVYDLRFLGQKQAKRGKRRIEENVATTRGIKTSTAGQNSFSELQNRSRNIDFICPATLSAGGRAKSTRLRSWTVHGLPSGEDVGELTMARIAALSGAGSFAQAVTTRARSGHDTTLIRESNRESARESLMFSPEIVGFESPSLRQLSLPGRSVALKDFRRRASAPVWSRL